MNPVPVIMTVVPPVVGPDEGATAVMVGGAAASAPAAGRMISKATSVRAASAPAPTSLRTTDLLHPDTTDATALAGATTPPYAQT